MSSFFKTFWEKHGEKIVSVLKGAAIAALGAGLTYALGSLGGFDFGAWEPTVVAALSVFVNIFRKFGIPIAIILFKGIRL